MIENIVRGVLVIIGMALFYQLTSITIKYYVLESFLVYRFGVLSPIVISAIGGLIGGLILFIISPWLINWGKKTTAWVETKLQKTPINEIIYGFFGLIMGLIVANLLTRAFLLIPWIGRYLPVLANIILGYLGMSIFLKKKEELSSILPITKTSLKDKHSSKMGNELKPKILDTSVIIDGRIADICETGFLEGKLVIPAFVLDELRHIADSSDLLKRNRGRRGLDILNKIQKELNVKVEIYNGDFDDIVEVDSKLVKLAQILKGQILTNDYNLNKVAELQGVQVLNINELANAVKPIVLPGEEMMVQVIKDGKESGQGIAYLDDGTMIVVDGGRKHIGENIGVLVTSVLQTAAGRMIFAKPKQEQKAL
ncbi:MAG TPA: PIN/TRAM domain-containing protein [Thermoanaerobacterales bacterium]|nr:PIN/TRAM domain-containing protein [Thermoanaerobacterales bacterium]